MFEPVNTRERFPELEQRILQYWKEHDIFARSVIERPEDKRFVFYEGPPTANARPGVHHVLSRSFKDLFPRYKTMRGYRVARKAGWDTHGLPVELEIERELGLHSKREIEEFGVEEFNRRCRESVFRYVQEWAALTERIGFWVDLDDAYITYDNAYIESTWWIVKQLWDNDLVYQDYRSAPHCPRCETSLSDAEVALGYEEDTPDPSVFVKFPLTEESRQQLGIEMPASLVAWTTTPWTLPGNTALAVNPDARYAVVLLDGEALILAAPLLDKALGELPFERVTTLGGNDLIGLLYQPPYQPAEWGVQAMFFDRAQGGRLLPVEGKMPETAHTVIAADFVSMEDGTGIVHIAPAFGGEDFDLGRELGLLFLQPVDRTGLITGGPFGGKFVKDADPEIIEDLQQRGLLLRHETILHTYPFCWRCKTPLLFYAKPTWYIRTTAVKEDMLQANARINWYPEHIKEGRFGNWLANNIDWAVGRERYWGTPFPVWQCASCGAHRCIGSRQELVEATIDKAAAEFLDDLHRPYIDRIRLRCEGCGGEMHRQLEVMDAWFDSGAMPYAQWHFPFENQATFRHSFPADFICEAVDQTRGWFYTLLAEAALLHHAAPDYVPEGIAYRNVISLGHIQDDKGRKMSKSLGNVVEPNSVIDVHGADALRWYLYTASPAGNPRRFSIDLVAESLRRFLLTLWNTYSFFVTYANIDGFNPSTSPRGELSELDRWILSELNALTEKVTTNLESYNATDSGRAIQDFVEELSNWYVRRSRRRFWKSENDTDKLAAYHTLYECLVTVTKLMAPFTPFITEAMYQNLVRAADPQAPESVHLAQWPESDSSLIDRKLMEETQLVMRVVSLGRAARSKAGIKVRQPLARVVIKTRAAGEGAGLQRLAPQVLEELNVKALEIAEDDDALAGLAAAPDEAGYTVALDTALTPELQDEGLARELVHRIQSLRKAAGFEIADRIVTYFSGWERLDEVVSEHGEYVRQETLSEELKPSEPPAGAFAEEQKLDGHLVRLAVQKLA